MKSMIFSEDQQHSSGVYFLQNHSPNYAEFFFFNVRVFFEGFRIIETTVDLFDLLRERSFQEVEFTKNLR